MSAMERKQGSTARKIILVRRILTGEMMVLWLFLPFLHPILTIAYSAIERKEGEEHHSSDHADVQTDHNNTSERGSEGAPSRDSNGLDRCLDRCDDVFPSGHAMLI
jgi:hypothetical protein